MAFTAEKGVTEKGERYDRSFLVKSSDKLYKRTEFNDFIYSSNNLDVGSIGLNKYGSAVISDVYEIFLINKYGIPDFISELIKRPFILSKILKYRQGCLYGQYKIYANDFLTVSVLAPSLEEQQKIADFLSLIDLRIEKQRQLVENLKKYKRGLLSDVFTHKKKEYDWRIYELSNILKERSIYCEKNGTYEHVTLSREGILPKTERYDRDFLVSSDNKKYKITKLGDICYNPANMKFGVICLNLYGDAIFSPIYVTFEINNNFDKYFIGLCLTRRDFINSSLKFQQGTVYERMAVSPNDLLSMKVEIPNLSAQLKISTIFHLLDEKIIKEVNKLKKLNKIKHGLLQQMFI